MTTDTIDTPRLDAFIGRFVGDLGTLMHATTVILGERLGLYAALADGTAVTSAELAARTGLDERYLREWLSAQAAAGYVDHDAATGRFTLPAEHAALLVEGRSPLFIPGAFQLAGSVYRDQDRIVDAWQAGSGLGWGDHHHDLFHGTERFFRPGYVANLVDAWLPALDGVMAKLERGAHVADVGCGLGASTILMARAFPESEIVGFDFHPESIELARKAAVGAGLGDRVRFEVAPAKAFGGSGYDLVTMFDCLHDMGDPAGAARHVHDALADDGTWMIVEPFAGERVEDNLNPVGKIFYAASCTICVPASRAQEVGLCLGAQASERALDEVVRAGGFGRFRRAAETPTNRVFEARK